MSKRPGDPGYADGWCIYYRAPPAGLRLNQPHICEAGVNMAVFDKTPFRNRPCFLDKGKPRPNSVPCQHLRLPTAEEIALHEKWLQQRVNLMRTVMHGIRPWREKHKGRSHTEVIECPACKGALYLSIAAYNGHVHGHCETENCVSWME